MRGRPLGALRRHQRCRRRVRGAREASGEDAEAWHRLRVSFIQFFCPPRRSKIGSGVRIDRRHGGRLSPPGLPPLPAAGRARRAAAAVQARASRRRTRLGGTVEAAPSRRARARPSRREGAASRRWHPVDGIEAPSCAMGGAPGRGLRAPGAVEAAAGDGVASGTLVSFGARSSVKCPADGGRAVKCPGRVVGVEEVVDQSVECLWHVKARNVRGVPDEQWRRKCR